MNNHSNFLFPTDLSENAELSLTYLLEEATVFVKDVLQQFANESNFTDKMQWAFGENTDGNQLRASWEVGELVLPQIEVISTNDINRANGAFAVQNNKIYLAQEFLLANQSEIDVVAAVLLEEYGHYLDSVLNSVDSQGDEGGIFSALVRGEQLSNNELQQLQSEDDSSVVIIDGEEVEIEQNINPEDIEITPIPAIDLSDGGASISGNRIVWEGNNGIKLYDIDTGSITQITNNDEDDDPFISGNQIVWTRPPEEEEEDTEGTVILYDINTGSFTPIPDIDLSDGGASISGNRIVWEGNNGIKLYDIDTGSITQITNNDEDDDPFISGNQIVWTRPSEEEEEDTEGTVFLATLPTEIDLKVEKTDLNDPVFVGSEVTYVLTVTNEGTGEAKDVRLLDNLPQGVEFVQAINSNDSDPSRNGVIDPTTSSNGTVLGKNVASLDFLLGDIPFGESALVNITVIPTIDSLPSSANSSSNQWQIVNNATVSLSPLQTDINSNNDQIAETTEVILPELSLTGISAIEGDNDNTDFNFKVSLSQASTATVSVNYATADNSGDNEAGASAIAGEDYTAVNGTLEFAPGETEKTITVQVFGNTELEPDETFSVNLSNPVNSAIADPQGIGTITNDDVNPPKVIEVIINDVSLAEGNDGNTNLNFKVSLSEASNETITVDYATEDDTVDNEAGASAIAGEDYTATNGTLEFAPGETEQTITVPVLNDSDFEAEEAFNINLSNATNANISDAQGMGIITNEKVDSLVDGLIQGNLSDSDDSYTYKNQDYYYDFYALPVDSSINPGATMSISLTSDDFRPLLMILDSEGRVIQIDRSSSQTTSSLNFEVPSGDPFFLSIETFEANSTGDYQLEIEMI